MEEERGWGMEREENDRKYTDRLGERIVQL